MKTFIVGHKNPDTDSVVSAIALAELEKSLGKDYTPAIADPVNKETIYVLDRFGFRKPDFILGEEKEVILVDHNEPSQISENVKNEEIVGIFDHHKLGGLSTPGPISVRMKPVGSTSTIIAQIFQSQNIKPKENIAGILLAGILSDTLKFNSPTSTKEDEEVAEFLNQIAKLNIDELAQEMFKAKSDLTGISSEELIDSDYKNFDIKGKKVGVGVFETVDPSPALERKEELVKTIAEKKNKENLSHLLFAIIDIIRKEAYFITSDSSDEELVKKALKVEQRDGNLVASGIVSRKKQIIPALEKSL